MLPLLGASPIILLAGLAIFFWLIKRSAKRAEPRADGSALEFFLAPGMAFLLSLVLLLLGAFVVLVLAVSLSRGGEGWYGVFIPLAVLVAIILAKPRAVLLDQNGVRQQRWLHKDREIPWAEIAWMRRGWRTGTTYVKSRNGGRPISFSPLLVGQARFEREVRAHAEQSGDPNNE
jgi:hypothetical protein